MATLVREAARDAKRIRLSASREGSNHNGAKVRSELVERYHYAWPCLADRAPASRVPGYEKHLSTSGCPVGYHRHSVSSKRVGVGGSSSWPPPPARSFRAASAHPLRGAGRAAITMVLPRSFSSTSSLKPACSISGFGSRTPREFPMRTSRVFMTDLQWAYSSGQSKITSPRAAGPTAPPCVRDERCRPCTSARRLGALFHRRRDGLGLGQPQRRRGVGGHAPVAARRQRAAGADLGAVG